MPVDPEQIKEASRTLEQVSGEIDAAEELIAAATDAGENTGAMRAKLMEAKQQREKWQRSFAKRGWL